MKSNELGNYSELCWIFLKGHGLHRMALKVLYFHPKLDSLWEKFLPFFGWTPFLQFPHTAFHFVSVTRQITFEQSALFEYFCGVLHFSWTIIINQKVAGYFNTCGQFSETRFPIIWEPLAKQVDVFAIICDISWKWCFLSLKVQIINFNFPNLAISEILQLRKNCIRKKTHFDATKLSFFAFPTHFVIYRHSREKYRKCEKLTKMRIFSVAKFFSFWFVCTLLRVFRWVSSATNTKKNSLKNLLFFRIRQKRPTVRILSVRRITTAKAEKKKSETRKKHSFLIIKFIS